VTPAEPPRWLVAVRQWRCYRLPWHLVILAAWAAQWFRVEAPGGGHSWELFVRAAKLFIGERPFGTVAPGGLSLYANYPRFQFGPVSLCAAALIRLIGPDEGVVAAQILMTAAGLAIVFLAERAARLARPDLDPDQLRWAALGAGLVFVPVWSILAVSFAHLDDALALLFAVLAAYALARGRPALTGLFLALAAGAKPWAFGFMALLFALPVGEGRRHYDRWRAAAWAAGGTIVLWAPFLIADPHSVAAARFTIANVPGSGLRALGVATPRTPSWDRAAQILIGFALAVIAVRRGRWPAIFFICMSVRTALDPNTYPYYDAGLVTGALIWDLMGARRAVPAWTLAAGSLFWGWTAAGGTSTLSGDLRVGFAVVVVAYTILAPAGMPASEQLSGTAAPPLAPRRGWGGGSGSRVRSARRGGRGSWTAVPRWPHPWPRARPAREPAATAGPAGRPRRSARW
jgi:hypothetical protein